MKNSVLLLALLLICNSLFSACVENQKSGVKKPTLEQTIVFEYKEKGIKNSFYINDLIRLSEDELNSLLPKVKLVWEKMVSALEQKDLETALTYFSPKMQKGFRSLLKDGLNSKFDEMIPMLKSTVFSPHQGTSKFIQCNIESGGTGASDVVFEKVNNEWKIGFL